jgi:hypothetical protein
VGWSAMVVGFLVAGKRQGAPTGRDGGQDTQGAGARLYQVTFARPVGACPVSAPVDSSNPRHQASHATSQTMGREPDGPIMTECHARRLDRHAARRHQSGMDRHAAAKLGTAGPGASATDRHMRWSAGAAAPSPGGCRCASGGTPDPCPRDHPARPGVKVERPQAASSPLDRPSWSAVGGRGRTTLTPAACRAGWYSRRARASAERGRVQGPGRAEADLVSMERPAPFRR